MSKLTIIKCPICGAEYLPEEIFYPDSVFNKNLNVVRDEEGKIVFVNEDSFCLTEEFECEHCGATFLTKGKVNFQTDLVKEEDFEEETTVKL